MTAQHSVRTNVVDPAKRFDWGRQVEAEDYSTFIAKIGCPEPTIRDIVLADLDANYATLLQRRLKAAGSGATNY